MYRKRVEAQQLELLIKNALRGKPEAVQFSVIVDYAKERTNGTERIDEMDLRAALWRLMSRDEVVLTSKRRIELANAA